MCCFDLNLFWSGQYKRKKNDGPRPKWTQAPESVMHDTYSRESDMFMFGLLLWELLNEKGLSVPPEIKENVDKFQSGLGSGESQKSLLSYLASGLDKNLLSFIERCLAFNPSDRPSASEFLFDNDYE